MSIQNIITYIRLYEFFNSVVKNYSKELNIKWKLA